MFKNPFSFEGRIRRQEYGLSMIIYLVVYFIFLAVLQAGTVGIIFGLVLFIPMLWFIWAQNAKRCHDLGNSGWWQLIPFYGLFLLFQDGKPGANEYGPNPKGVGDGTFTSNAPVETLDGHLR